VALLISGAARPSAAQRRRLIYLWRNSAMLTVSRLAGSRRIGFGAGENFLHDFKGARRAPSGV